MFGFKKHNNELSPKIRVLGTVQTARLQALALRKFMVSTDTLADKLCIDYATRDYVEADVDEKTGEIVFIFKDPHKIPDFINAVNAA